MIANDDYPRMMFQRGKEPVIVQNEQEETALGAEWSRRVPLDDPDETEDEPEEPEENGDEEAPDSEDEPAELTHQGAAPIRKRAPRPASGRRKRGD